MNSASGVKMREDTRRGSDITHSTDGHCTRYEIILSYLALSLTFIKYVLASSTHSQQKLELFRIVRIAYELRIRPAILTMTTSFKEQGKDEGVV
ncbi:unnamed protein product [Cercopithifilaria johnstoni]|uniref:Uncharacterized protein n=1 Tax=Cercopithifilaria johnstoni TaxID=2874296 RepID=A0A8J2M1B3_9BILA|nr:unnamed protein product [Cercopithifilaria johnstoni]